MSLEEIEDESYPEYRDTRSSLRKLNVLSEGEKRFRRQIKYRAIVVKTIRNQTNGKSTSEYCDHVIYSLNKDKRWEKNAIDFLNEEDGSAFVERKMGSKVLKSLPSPPKRAPATLYHWSCQAENPYTSEKFNAVLAMSSDVMVIIEVPTAIVHFASPPYKSYTNVGRHTKRDNVRFHQSYLVVYDGGWGSRFEIDASNETIQEMRDTLSRCREAEILPERRLPYRKMSIEDELIDCGNWVALNAVRKLGNKNAASQRNQKLFAEDHSAMVNRVLGIREDGLEKSNNGKDVRSYWDAEQGVVALHTVDDSGNLTTRKANGRGVNISGLVRRNKEEADNEAPDVLYNIIRPELHKSLAKKTFRREKPQLKREKKNSFTTDDISDF